MTLSIIIPTCDRSSDLSICLSNLLSSLLNIRNVLWEVIVTDDSSGYETKQLIDDSFDSVRWVRGLQKGPASNRNNGARFANYDWLIFLDDDCIPTDKLIKAYVLAIRNSPYIQVFEGAVESNRKRTSMLEYAPLNTTGGCLWSCNFCIHKDAFFKVGGFDSFFKYPHMEDIDLSKRLTKEGYTIEFVRSAVVYHPWRKVLSGKKLGKYQEMFFYYSAKHKQKIGFWDLIIKISLFHYSMIKQGPFNKDIFIAITVSFEHLIYVVFHFNKWINKYKKLELVWL